ncbi:aspartyl/asparaginyl beta-hydroxylase domain-containing protein [Sphingomonas sanguinis]|uniref:Aspartyl/asparaginyl beta-hydroxylase domain-containing protein n=1 Tax=Sphingomonas sanguinis TaxID=33051 RepID=A0ABU5LQA4_9SPHN|nr:aspartyl/asparaginyl beta-hydroxylase domain-containing protein [Sphingomonas sanguinis]MDZ7282124.1 aspartyl/asparaginyl beta-hydroxylase domain-containing protein [Sphingomonas sanguinis]QXT35238.1 aspartyl/asparaginyl beta-hydroxylase domain-containing protein [Sphingomonas sanguinis]
MTKSIKASAQRQGPATIWHNSGEAERPVRPVPTLVAAIPSLPSPPASPHPALAALCRVFDGVIAASSLVPNDPVLDIRDFGWTAGLRRQWRAIRDEAVAVSGPASTSRIVPLLRGGETANRCPVATAALAEVPGLHDAAFALLSPGAHVEMRRGATKGLLTCHLGLAVPRDGGARMRVRDRIVRWAEGETLIFDDSYPHELWNDAEAARIVLRLRFARPLRQPGRAVADGLLRLIGETA